MKEIIEKYINIDPENISILFKEMGEDYFIGYNDDLEMPAASLLKIPISLCFLHYHQDNLNDFIDFERVLNTKYSTLWPGFEGCKLNYRSLLSLSLSLSDNPASNKLIEKLGMFKINAFINQELKLKKTKLKINFADQFLNEKGLANTTCALDCLKILEYTYQKNSLASTFLFNSLRNQRIPKFLPEGIKVMHKTGTLSGAISNIGLVRGENPFYLVILTKNQKSIHETSLWMANLSLELYKKINS